MIGSLLQPELVELIRQRNFNQLREILCGFPAPDIAEIFTDLSADDEAVLMRILPHDLAADVFEYLSVEDQEKLVQALGNEQVAQILNEMPPDDRTALLEELPSAATQKLLNLLSPAERKIAADLLGYPKDSIGRRMTPEYIAIQQNWTVAEVLAHLRLSNSAEWRCIRASCAVRSSLWGSPGGRRQSCARRAKADSAVSGWPQKAAPPAAPCDHRAASR